MNLRDKTISGIGWSTLAQLLKQGFTIVIAVLLARVLEPEEFGLVAAISVFTRFAGVLSDFGLGSALIQRDNISESHFSSVFWFNLALGIAIGTVVLLLAPWLGVFYDKPELVGLARLASVNFALAPLYAVHRSKLRRDMSFKALGLTDLSGVIVGGIVGLAMAHLAYSSLSLIVMELAGTVALIASSFLATRWIPQSPFRWAAIRDLARFSANLMGFNIVNYWTRNLDNLLIGKFLGEFQLGIYSRSYSMMFLPVSQISEALRNVMFPALSRVGSEIDRIRSIYLRSTASIWFVSAPLMMGLFTVCHHAIPYLLGPKWEGMVPVFRVLCLLGAVQSVMSTVGWIYLSQGRTDLMFRWSLFAGFTVMIGFVIGVQFGSAYAVAVSYCITSGVLLSYPSFIIPGRLIKLPFRVFLQNLQGVTLCTVAMGGIVLLTDHWLAGRFSYLISLLILVPIGIIAYVSLVIGFQLKAYRDVRELVRERMPKR